MMFDYSCCDFCPYDTEYTTGSGSVCQNCQAKAAERKLNRMMVDIIEKEESSRED